MARNAHQNLSPTSEPINIDILEIQKKLEMEDAETRMASNPTNSLANEKETVSKSSKFIFISYDYAKIYH